MPRCEQEQIEHRLEEPEWIRERVRCPVVDPSPENEPHFLANFDDLIILHR